MITEDYVSFETAKLLKERGFDDEYTNAFYDKNGNLYFIDTLSDLSEHTDNDTDIAASTLYMTMKWLREVHNIHISVDIHWLYFANQNGWMYIITKILENGTDYVDSKGDENDKHFYSTYEEACEAAIKYCLKNLI